MEYTVIMNGRSYDLPKKTVAVMEQLDYILKIDNCRVKARQKFERMHAFVKEMIGEENAKEAFESDNLEEIDMSELALAILKINDAYNQPLTDYKFEKMRAVMNSMQTDKIAALANSASTIANIQGNANA